jgi:hypothetical protein
MGCVFIHDTGRESVVAPKYAPASKKRKDGPRHDWITTRILWLRGLEPPPKRRPIGFTADLTEKS